MDLKRVTLAVLVTTSVLFLLRLLGTFLPGMFFVPGVALTSVVAHLLADLAALAFFLLFFLQVARTERMGLRQAALLGAVGVAIGALLPLQTALRVTHIAVFSPLATSPFIEPLAPLVALLTILFFFVTYSRVQDDVERRHLGPFTWAAGAGVTLFLALHLLVLVLYLRSGDLRWIAEGPLLVRLATLPLIVAGLAGVLSFYFAFLRYLRRSDFALKRSEA